MNITRLVFLVSGNGGTLKFLYHSIKLYNLPLEVVGIISDRPCEAIDFGKKCLIKSTIFPNWNEQQEELILELKDLYPDFIFTTVHKILGNKILVTFGNIFINLHYSLLPSFGGVIGMKTVKMAKIANSKIIGATCHYVSDVLDGGEIICQGAMGVNWQDETEFEIENKVFRLSCIVFLNSVLNILGIDKKAEQKTSEYLINPPIRFDDSKLDDIFWLKLIKKDE